MSTMPVKDALTGEPFRLAGIFYLIVVVTGIFSLGYVPSHISQSTQPEVVARSIVDSQMLFRLGIMSFLVNQVAFTLLPLALFRLLRSVSQTAATVMVVFALMSVPIALVNIVNRLDALSLATDLRYAGTLTPEQLQAHLIISLGEYRNGMHITKLFWGLWLWPFGYLVYKSKFLPKVLGILLMIGCASYMVDVFGRLLIPSYSELAVTRYVMKPAGIAEIGTCLWLLFVGARFSRGGIPTSAASDGG